MTSQWARYLERHFGHRTLTHSLLAFVVLGGMVGFVEGLCGEGLCMTLIFVLGYGSHLIFDMMTVEGVPLGYPFSRRVCVMPAGAHMRLRSGDFKTEAVFMVLALLVGVTCRPLFEEGFRSCFNRSFGTLKHLHSEFVESEELLEVVYACSHLGKRYEGVGYVVDTTPYRAVLYRDGCFLEVTSDFKLKRLLVSRTGRGYETREVRFVDADAESVLCMVRDKAVVRLQLRCGVPVRYMQDRREVISQVVDLGYVYSPVLHFGVAAPEVALQQKAQRLEREARACRRAQEEVRGRIGTLRGSVCGLDYYGREQVTREVAVLEGELSRLLGQGRSLEERLGEVRCEIGADKGCVCSGYVEWLVLE